MSTQRGNLNKKGQKYHNRSGFKNDKYDSSKRTEQLNQMVITNVCEKCKSTIEWKIKYKKYKPLTCPQKCVKCSGKCVKAAYHIMCTECAQKEQLCAKCGKKGPVVHAARMSASEEQKEEHSQKEELSEMRLRDRRAFLRQLERESRGVSSCPPPVADNSLDNQVDDDEDDSTDTESGPPLDAACIAAECPS